MKSSVIAIRVSSCCILPIDILDFKNRNLDECMERGDESMTDEVDGCASVDDTAQSLIVICGLKMKDAAARRTMSDEKAGPVKCRMTSWRGWVSMQIGTCA